MSLCKRVRRDAMVKTGVLGVAGAAWLLASTSVGAIPVPTETGTFDGVTWTATSLIVGVTSTATGAPPTPPGKVGNPIYWAHSPKPYFNNNQYSGVVALILTEATGVYICSGSLLSDRVTVLTAGHCVSNGHSNITTQSATAYFYNGTDPQAIVGAATPAGVSPGVVGVQVASESVNPLYTGEVIDDHDIAVVKLATPAPAWATSYSLDTSQSLVGDTYNIAGYGQRSDQGGRIGADLGTGRLRQGTNRYDFTFGDPAFQGFFDGGPNGFFGTAETTHSYVADFDDGRAANDGSCQLAAAFGAGGSQFCNLGTGGREVSSAGGDSGGPQFVNGKIASVTSYGLSFGTTFGDIDNTLNSSFGEFNGFVPVNYNRGWIDSVADVPEPASWAMMVAGFGLVGVLTRRRRTAFAA